MIGIGGCDFPQTFPRREEVDNTLEVREGGQKDGNNFWFHAPSIVEKRRVVKG
jgi:hypothetical protein